MKKTLLAILVAQALALSMNAHADESCCDIKIPSEVALQVAADEAATDAQYDDIEFDGNKNATYDPLEPFNRTMYKFNDAADKAVLKPVATAYTVVVPSPIRSGVHNFFGNMRDVVTLANEVLQFKFIRAVNTTGRIVFNSTFGLLGLIDWASMNEMEKHHEDFGTTLAHWGVGSGAYIVLPLFGSSSVRDLSGVVVDSQIFNPRFKADGALEPLYNANVPADRNYALLIDSVDTRAQYIKAGEIVDDAALDPYIMVREAYMSRRNGEQK